MAVQRGTRPRNRRALIVAAATELFHRRGYDRLGMGDIAEAVSIGPSALYRHFSGKQDLLREVLTEGLAPVREAVAGLDLSDRATALSQLSAVALDHRELGVLWQREARHLPADDLAALRAELSGIGDLLARRIHAVRGELSPAAADLLAWSVLAVLTSLSFHRLDLPRPEYDDLLGELVVAILDLDLPEPRAVLTTESTALGLVPQSRREALLMAAVRLFAREGYPAVGIEDIGAAVGISGPSVYNHFASKSDMLLTALRRGISALFIDLSAIYRTAADQREGLTRLVSSYVDVAVNHHDMIDSLITETVHLPEEARREVVQAQREYVGEWIHLLRGIHPELDPTTARIRVQAALNVVIDAARTPRLRRDPGLADSLQKMCACLLRLDA